MRLVRPGRTATIVSLRRRAGGAGCKRNGRPEGRPSNRRRRANCHSAALASWGADPDRSLVAELLDGKLDLLLLAMPIEESGVEARGLFEDRFLLATSQDYDTSKMLLPVEEIMARETPLLLEEGHCLRDQALSFCNFRRNDKVDTFGVSSLSTVAQMVADGHGMTLLPEIVAQFETRRSPVKLMRFAPPDPAREIGLAWRASSPHKEDFVEFGRLVCVSLGLGGAGARRADD